MLTIITPKRPPDGYGSGEYRAPRAGRKHNGVDFACYPGSELLSPVTGRVTKLGYPYRDDLTYRYVEITDSADMRHRFFYVSPLVDVGKTVMQGEPIGTVQDIAARYNKKPMTVHIHYEIKKDGKYFNPEVWG